MSFIAAVFLGLIQGLTEFLPISSSAHLQLATSLMHLELTKPQLTAFIATIQLGTELAVLIYFAKDILRILKAWFTTGFTKKASQDAKLGWYVIIGSIPVVVVGLALKDLIENQLRSLQLAAFMLIIFGIVLLVADRRGAKTKSIEKLTTKSAVLFGIGQMLAVIPGVSRSGGTISAGLFMGFTRQAAARYSFLLAVPAVLASGIYEFAKTYKDLPSSLLLGTGVATVVSFVVGFAVIAGLLKYLNKGSFLPFVLWRIAVGVSILAISYWAPSSF
ncbi:MAG: undecaprenyl-diphosphate phosphatase [Rhodoluna sp.]|nr:undecaprenyl-diphosphate phosphatase [Rhodoluna sp.]